MKKAVSALLALAMLVLLPLSVAAYSAPPSIQWVETIDGVDTTVFGTVDASSLSDEAKDILRRFSNGEFEDYVLVLSYYNNTSSVSVVTLYIMENGSKIPCEHTSATVSKYKPSQGYYQFFCLSFIILNSDGRF